MKNSMECSICLYYGKWVVCNLPADDAVKANREVFDKTLIIQMYDTKIEAERFCQGIEYASLQMNANTFDPTSGPTP